MQFVNDRQGVSRLQRSVQLLAIVLFSVLVQSSQSFAQTKTIPSTGVASEGVNSSRWNSDFDLFTRHPTLGITQTQVDSKLQDAWKRYSGQLDTSGGYQVIKLDAADSTLAYADVNVSAPNNTWDGGPRACTEGQGWAMMLAVQANDQAMFDKLWKFTRKYLQYRNNGVTNRGWLFCWQCLPQSGGGVKYKNGNLITNDGPAPDGEQWISAALYCAAGRGWPGTGINYKDEADNVTKSMLHLEEWNGSRNPLTNLFQNNQVVYIPGDFRKGPSLNASQISDPSYVLPAFYQLYASVGPTADQSQWQAIASRARTVYFPRALGQESSPVNDNAATALAPFLTALDGTGYDCLSTEGEGSSSGHQTAGDGLRTPSNIGVDYMWWGDSTSTFNLHRSYGNKILTYFANPKPYNNASYTLTPFGNQGWGFPYNYNRFYYGGYVFTNGRDGNGNSSSNHNECSTGMNAVAAQVATISDSWKFVQELWEAPQPRRTGTQSTSTWGDPYWDGTLYLLGLYESAGKFRPYGVGGATAGGPTFSSTTSISPGTTVSTGSSVTATTVFTNTGGNMSNGKLGMRLLDSAGNYVNQTTAEGVNLSGGATYSQPWTFNAPTIAGSYSLYVGAWDSSWNGYYWQNRATLTVTSGSTAPSINATGSVSPGTSVTVGSQITISATFTNSGGNMNNGKLGFRLIDSAGNYANQTTTEGVNLAGGANKPLTWTIAAPTTAGTYQVVAGAWDASWSGYLWKQIATITTH